MASAVGLFGYWRMLYMGCLKTWEEKLVFPWLRKMNNEGRDAGKILKKIFKEKSIDVKKRIVI